VRAARAVHRARRVAPLGVCLVALGAGGALWGLGLVGSASAAWAAGTLLALVPLSASIVRDLLARRVGVDVIALLAMVGSLALGEYLAGIVIAIMLSGGEVLEWWAGERARRELTSLVRRTPRTAHRVVNGGGIEDVGVGLVRPGDVLQVTPGEVVPVDGRLLEAALLDESALTGEAMPVERARDDEVRSGVVNAGRVFRMTAAAAAEASTYAAIVRLTEAAAASRAPLVRIADRFAIVFLPLTLVMAGAAWAWTGDPVRALAVLVVATPCPLILAAPIAIVAGMSRAAGRGVVLKGGGVLESLGRARVVLFDKTGTLTRGTPVLTRVLTFGRVSDGELLRLAASLDVASAHTLAASIVDAARARGLRLAPPSDVDEVQGAGIRGVVDGRRVALGKAAWAGHGAPLPATVSRLRARSASDGRMTVFVAIDGSLAGVLLFEDHIRDEASLVVRLLRREGVRRVLVVTGDAAAIGERIGRAIGADGVLAEQAPAEKLAAVAAEHRHGVTVMVGDGVNDAPALAAADVGVAMGARGATASSEAAGAVVTVDRLDRVVDAVAIARRARSIAMQSILAGMGLSVAAMAVAASGHLAPVEGAVLQEAIDVAVILNALRVLVVRGRPGGRPGDAAVSDRITAEHRRLEEGLDDVLAVADGLGVMPPHESLRRLQEVRDFLVSAVLPHEAEDEARLLPVVDRAIGGRAPTEVTSRAHREIQAQVRALDELVRMLPPAGPGEEDLPELRRALYGLHAVLRLHFAQEDQSYLPLLRAG
jgi:heavy metal translocating P-type ATPase